MFKWVVKDNMSPTIRNVKRKPGDVLPDPRNEFERGGYEALHRRGELSKVPVRQTFEAPVKKPVSVAIAINKTPSWQQK